MNQCLVNLFLKEMVSKRIFGSSLHQKAIAKMHELKKYKHKHCELWDTYNFNINKLCCNDVILKKIINTFKNSYFWTLLRKKGLGQAMLNFFFFFFSKISKGNHKLSKTFFNKTS